MIVELNTKNVGKFVGWTAVTLFWIGLIGGILSLFGMSGDSGAGEVIYFTTVFMGMTFPLLIIPVGILIYGVRKDNGPIALVILKWGTIAMVTYIISLAITAKFFF